MSDDPLNLDEWRIKDLPPQPETMGVKAPPKKRKPFVVKWVPVPRWWKEALRGASGSAYELALIILEEEYKLKHSPFPGEITLSEVATKMPSSTRERARLELVSLGLIEVEQNGNQAFVATKVHPLPKMGSALPENGEQGTVLSFSMSFSYKYRGGVMGGWNRDRW
jgi:hypothetical protein